MPSWQKTLLAVAVTALISTGVLYISAQFVLGGSFHALEQHAIGADLGRATKALDNQQKILEHKVADWAIWDDAYEFMQDANAEFVETNLPDGEFLLLDVNLIVMAAPDGRIVYENAYDLVKREPAAFPVSLRPYLQDQTDRRLLVVGPQETRTGILDLPEGPLLVVAHPILTSQGGGPYQGTMIFARYLDATFMQTLSEMASAPVSVYRLDETNLPAEVQKAREALSVAAPVVVQPLSEDEVSGYVMHPDLFGQPSFLLRVDRPRTLYHEGQVLLNYFVFWLSGIGLLFGMVNHWTVRQWNKSRKEQHNLAEKYRCLVEQSTDGIAMIDREGKIIEWNRSQAVMTGMSREEVLGHPLAEVRWWMAAPEEKTAEAVEEFGTQLTDRLHAEQMPWAGKVTRYKARRPDGTERIFEMATYPIRTDAGALLASTSRDITEQQKAELALRESQERYRTVVEDQTDLICRWQPDGSLSFMNDAFCRVLTAISPEDVAKIRAFAVSTHPEEPTLTGELSFRTLDGQERWYQWKNRAIVADGKLMEIQSVGRDITDRKRAEMELRHRFEGEQRIGAISTRFVRLASEEMDGAIHQALETLGQFAGADRSYIFAVLEDGALWSNTHEWCAEGIEPQIGHLQNLRADDMPWWQAKLDRLEPLRIPVVADLPTAAAAEKAVLQAQGIQSAMVVPMVYGKTLVGFLGLDAVRARRWWREEDITLLTLAAEIFVNALMRKRVEEAERQQRQLAEALRDTAASLNHTLDSNAVLDRILTNVERVVPHEAATIMLVEQDVARVVRSRGFAERKEEAALMAWRAVIGQTVGFREMRETGAPYIVADIDRCGDWEGGWHKRWERSYLGVPIRARGQVIGFLNLYSQQAGHFMPAHAQRLQAFADQVSIALTNARLYEETKRAGERLQALSHRLVEIQEIERGRISRELHDQVGQSLTSMMVNLKLAEQHAGEPEAILTYVNRLRELTNGVMEELHRLAVALRPASLDHAGLVAALRQYVRGYGQEHGLNVQFETVGLNGHRMPVEVETALYRIVQESLTNVVRHSRANRVDVILERRADHIILVVEDDGLGFEPDAIPQTGHLGVAGMRERTEMLGGKLTIESTAGTGTTIQVEVPCVDTNSYCR